MRLNLIIGCLLFVTLSGSNSFGTEWRLGLCYSQGATVTDKAYLTPISVLSSHVYKITDSSATTEVKRRQCVEEPDIDCYTEKNVTYCREEPLAHLIRSAMWLAAANSLVLTNQGSDVDKLSGPQSITWIDAYLLGQAQYTDNVEKLDKLSKTIMQKRRISKDVFNKIQTTFSSLNKSIVAGFPLSAEQMKDPVNQLLVDSLDYAFSFLMGHETYHINSKCPIVTKSKIEIVGVFDKIYKLQQKGSLYDWKIGIDPYELNADRCGFRFMEKMAATKTKTRTPLIEAQSKRMAIDLLAGSLLLGLRGVIKTDAKGEDIPVVKTVGGYLYPQSRLILVSAALRSNEPNYPWSTKICNDAAKAIVSIIQDAVTNYPASSGDVPDELLAELPAGVEKSWNGNTWTESSFMCTPGAIK